MRKLIAVAALLVASTVSSFGSEHGNADSIRVCNSTGCSYTASKVDLPSIKYERSQRVTARPSKSLDGFPHELVTKVRELESACGSRVISAFRPGARIAGTRTPSLHASKRAVDMAGNPSCMYSRLQGWPGGVSTDYHRVAHIHLSYAPGGYEFGKRFAHYRSKRGYGG